MALQSPGLGSGLDVNSIVTQLVAAERAPAQQRLTRVGSEIDATLSAFGTLRGALSNLQGSVATLKSESQMLGRKAEVSDNAVLRAATTSRAAVGTYAVEVVALASAHKLASAAYAAGSGAAVGSGSLTFEQNGKSFTVAVAAGTTVAQLRDAINAAPGNTGLRAGIVQTDDGARLVLTANSPGTAQSIRVRASDAADGLDRLVFDPGVASTMSVLSPAANAQAKVEGYTVSASGNTISGAIEGVTLDLLAARPGSTLTVAVSQDTTPMRDRISKLVADYNATAATLSRLRAYDPATRSGGPLIGDATLLSIESRIRRDLSGPPAPTVGSRPTLSTIGVGMGADGRLQLNDAMLSSALRDDPAGVARVFAGAGGVAIRLDATLDGAIAVGGQVSSRTDSLQGQKRDLKKAQDALEVRMTALEARYRAQFTNLDTLLSGMQSTGNYLARQLK